MPGPFLARQMGTQRRTGTAEAPAPTFREGVSASFQQARNDFIGAQSSDLNQSYDPLVEQLVAAGRPASRYVRLAGPRAGRVFDPDRIWADIAAARQADPSAFKDVPADRTAFEGNTVAKFRARAGQADATASRAGLGARLFGGAAASVTDPVDAALMLAGGGVAKGFWGAVAREGIVNGLGAAAQQPLVAFERNQQGRTLTAEEAAVNVGAGALLGGVVGGAGHVLPSIAGQAKTSLKARAIDPARTNLSRVWDRMPEAVRNKWKRAEDVTDADLPEIAEAVIGRDRMTADEQHAVDGLRRDAQIAASSPFERGAGTAAHIDRVTDAADRLARGLPVRPEVPNVGRELSPNRIIGFVQNDLEGGARLDRSAAVDGGLTKYGIAAKFNPGVDIENLTEAEARRIAHAKYWFPELNQADPRLAAVAFDAGYIGGPNLGKRILRESGGDADRALELYRAHLNRLAETNPAKAKWRRGWNNRIDKLARFVGEGEGAPRLRPDVFEADADGDVALAQAAFREAQRDLNAAEPGYRAARAADEDDVPFDLDDPRGLAANTPERDPFAYLDEESDAPAPRADDGEPVVRQEDDPDTPVQRADPKDEPIAMEGSARESDEPDAIDALAPRPEVPDTMPATAAGIPQTRLVEVDTGQQSQLLRRMWAEDVARGERPAPVYALRPKGGGELVTFETSLPAIARVERDPPIEGDWEVARVHPPEDLGELAPATQREALAAFDDPEGVGVIRQIDSLEHDLRMALEEEGALMVRLNDDGDVVSAADMLDELDEDFAAYDRAAGCMVP